MQSQVSQLRQHQPLALCYPRDVLENYSPVKHNALLSNTRRRLSITSPTHSSHTHQHSTQPIVPASLCADPTAAPASTARSATSHLQFTYHNIYTVPVSSTHQHIHPQSSNHLSGHVSTIGQDRPIPAPSPARFPAATHPSPAANLGPRRFLAFRHRFSSIQASAIAIPNSQSLCRRLGRLNDIAYQSLNQSISQSTLHPPFLGDYILDCIL